MRPAALLTLAAALTLPLGADAQARRPPRGGAAAQGDASGTATLAEAEPPSVAMPDAETLIQFIQSAAVSGSAAGARSIAQLLARGVSPRVSAAGLDALGVMGRPEAAPAVVAFLQHRRASLRRHAIAAAQAIHTPDLVRALAGALGDSDEDVRVEAATALGEVGGPGVTHALFAAFERDLETPAGPAGGRLTQECAKAIARVGSGEDVSRLLSFLRRAPFRAMADAMRAALARPALPEALKLRVVAAVGDLATREVRDFLTSVVADAHGEETAVARAARSAAERIAE